ncbi:IucA/IucC family protein [Paenibacillus sp. SGZ-1009]|uniref:IucA/IucC family protein n=1 Tax=Paenibacillus campi TaxID=3106031 RepID=UPI002AFF18E5|nr:IucA/IucC family protein [Paenibacillus sp. SGZ-1009]
MSSQTITTSRSGKQIAKRRIMQDLIDALLTEELLTEPQTEIVRWQDVTEDERRLYEGDVTENELGNREGWLYRTGKLLLRIQPNIRIGRAWLTGSAIYHYTATGAVEQITDPAKLAQIVLHHVLSAEAHAQPGVAEFITGINTAVHQLALALEDEPMQRLKELQPTSAYEWYIVGEQIAALRDRPFHPSSKAKTGFSEQDCLHYAAEFGQSIKLRWLALHNETVQAGTDEPLHSCLELLLPAERHLLEMECHQLGLDTDHYTLLPLHPWQLEHVILPNYSEELAQGSVIVLQTEAGDVLATSSLRSMASVQPSTAMLKLPVSVLSLGAARYLPVVKLLNGLSGERMLRQAVACDEQLAQRVYLCQENHWWGYMPSHLGLFDDHPRHLAAQLRIYPEELLDESKRIVPMAALGVELDGTHLLTRLLGKAPSESEVLQFYTDVAELFYDVTMRLFKVGVVPEIHGQNCCLVLDQHRPSGLLFRDHDSVRLHPPYTERHGIEDPRYHIRPGYSNSLYNETLEKLIFYVQSLGTQVNLAAIMESLANVYGIHEQKLWQITATAWQKALAAVQLPEADRELLYRCIFEASQWRTKLIVRPLLEADGVPGAMPSGKGYGHNPFYGENAPQ